MSEHVVIGAAEVGEYVFCHRAWWLQRVKGVASGNETELRDGARMHAHHGGSVRTASWMLYFGYILALLGLLLAVLWMLPYFL